MAVAARNLRGDVQHLNLSNSLKFFTASKKQPNSNRSSSQPPKAKPQVQQPVIQAAGRGRVGQASRGKPNKASRGRGRVRSRNIPDFYPPPLLGCRSHPSRSPISVQSLPPIGGRLSAFSAEWTKIGASEWVRRTLLEGYSLPFSSLPPLTSPVFLASYQNPEKRRALHVAVKEMEMKGAIEVVRTPSPGFYSRLFLVPKARGAWRPIIDLSVLNTHIQCPSFQMETNGSLLKALQKGQWLTILDLKDAYFHIPIHPSYRQYLRFCHEGVVWQFRALPFGLTPHHECLQWSRHLSWPTPISMGSASTSI